MLQPKRVKHRKVHRGRRRGLSSGNTSLSFGEYGLQATEACWMSSRQIEAGRRAITRYVRRGGKLWITVYPDKPITKKPLEVRQGKGKGNVEYWVAQIQPGRILYEMSGVEETLAEEAFKLAAAKLPIGTKFVSRDII